VAEIAVEIVPLAQTSELWRKIGNSGGTCEIEAENVVYGLKCGELWRKCPKSWILVSTSRRNEPMPYKETSREDGESKPVQGETNRTT